MNESMVQQIRQAPRAFGGRQRCEMHEPESILSVSNLVTGAQHVDGKRADA